MKYTDLTSLAASAVSRTALEVDAQIDSVIISGRTGSYYKREIDYLSSDLSWMACMLRGSGLGTFIALPDSVHAEIVSSLFPGKTGVLYVRSKGITIAEIERAVDSCLSSSVTPEVRTVLYALYTRIAKSYDLVLINDVVMMIESRIVRIPSFLDVATDIKDTIIEGVIAATEMPGATPNDDFDEVADPIPQAPIRSITKSVFLNRVLRVMKSLRFNLEHAMLLDNKINFTIQMVRRYLNKVADPWLSARDLSSHPALKSLCGIVNVVKWAQDPAIASSPVNFSDHLAGTIVSSVYSALISSKRYKIVPVSSVQDWYSCSVIFDRSMEKKGVVFSPNVSPTSQIEAYRLIPITQHSKNYDYYVVTPGVTNFISAYSSGEGLQSNDLLRLMSSFLSCQVTEATKPFLIELAEDDMLYDPEILKNCGETDQFDIIADCLALSLCTRHRLKLKLAESSVKKISSAKSQASGEVSAVNPCKAVGLELEFEIERPAGYRLPVLAAWEFNAAVSRTTNPVAALFLGSKTGFAGSKQIFQSIEEDVSTESSLPRKRVLLTSRSLFFADDASISNVYPIEFNEMIHPQSKEKVKLELSFDLRSFFPGVDGVDVVLIRSLPNELLGRMFSDFFAGLEPLSESLGFRVSTDPGHPLNGINKIALKQMYMSFMGGISNARLSSATNVIVSDSLRRMMQMSVFWRGQHYPFLRSLAEDGYHAAVLRTWAWLMLIRRIGLFRDGNDLKLLNALSSCDVLADVAMHEPPLTI